MDMAYLLGPLDMVLLSTLFRIVGLSGRAFVADPSDGGAEGAEADAQRAATASSDVSYGVDGGNPVMASSSPSSTHEATEESSPAGASFGRRDPDPASPERISQWHQRMRVNCRDYEQYKMSPEQQQEFKDAIHICPTWSQANRKSFDYLNDALTEPIAIV
ncbi:hypothetical protein THAOC_20264, partial [Thalassiosira oceanica]